jgi:hypothetical protein
VCPRPCVVLNGTVKPEGVEVTECVFEYGAKEDYDLNGTDLYVAGRTSYCEPAAGSIPDQRLAPDTAPCIGCRCLANMG